MRESFTCFMLIVLTTLAVTALSIGVLWFVEKRFRLGVKAVQV